MQVDITLSGDDQILVECEGGPTICLEHVTPGRIVRAIQEGLERRALFVGEAEATVLTKMIQHALTKLKLTEQSRTLLQGLLPLVESAGGRDGHV